MGFPRVIPDDTGSGRSKSTTESCAWADRKCPPHSAPASAMRIMRICFE